MPMTVPGWPDPAFSMASMASVRIVLMARRSWSRSRSRVEAVRGMPHFHHKRWPPARGAECPAAASSRAMPPTDPRTILFDIDGTLIVSGGAGAASWRLAFDELYGIPADIGQFTDIGMTDPQVGRLTFEAVLHRKPERREFTKLLERRLHHLRATVADSPDYRVLPGVETLLARLLEEGHLLGLVTGNVEGAAHIKLHRANLNRFFSFGGYGSDSNDRPEVARIALRRAVLVYGEPIEPAGALVVGDTPHDVDAAHAAGIRCVGVGSH